MRGAEAAGLGLLDVTTTFGPDKVLRLHDEGGYEIHHGRVEHGDVDEFLGGAHNGSVYGTMRHREHRIRAGPRVPRQRGGVGGS